MIPVALGLLWYPAVGRLGRRGLDFVLALTLGLLLFLLIDTVEDGLEAAGEIAASYQGTVLFLGVALLSFLGIETLGAWLRGRYSGERAGWITSLLIAIGIGLHNFGEGLAIGAAYGLGEISLGSAPDRRLHLAQHHRRARPSSPHSLAVAFRSPTSCC